MFWQLYLFSIVDNVKVTLSGLTWLSFVFAVMACFILMMAADNAFGDDSKTALKLSRRAALSFAFLWFFILVFNMALPDQKGIAMIIGGSAAYSVIQSPEAKEIGGKALLLLNQRLDESLKIEAPKGEAK